MLCDDCLAWHDMSNEINGSDGCCSYGDEYVDEHSYEFKNGWGCYKRKKTIMRDLCPTELKDLIESDKQYAKFISEILGEKVYV